jgi:hypothetical protein
MMAPTSSPATRSAGCQPAFLCRITLDKILGQKFGTHELRICTWRIIHKQNESKLRPAASDARCFRVVTPHKNAGWQPALRSAHGEVGAITVSPRKRAGRGAGGTGKSHDLAIYLLLSQRKRVILPVGNPNGPGWPPVAVT